ARDLRHHQRDGDAGPDLPTVALGDRAEPPRGRVLVLGVVGLPGRARVLVRLRSGRDRGTAARRGAARGGRRGVGAVGGRGPDAPYLRDPLRAHDWAPITDGAAAIVLAAGHRAGELCERPAWITGLEHRVDSPAFGARDLTTAPSAAAAARAAGSGGVEVAELASPFSPQELVLRRELGLGEDVTVNPSGGPLCGNPMFAGGL